MLFQILISLLLFCVSFKNKTSRGTILIAGSDSAHVLYRRGIIGVREKQQTIDILKVDDVLNHRILSGPMGPIHKGPFKNT